MKAIQEIDIIVRRPSKPMSSSSFIGFLGFGISLSLSLSVRTPRLLEGWDSRPWKKLLSLASSKESPVPCPGKSGTLVADEPVEVQDFRKLMNISISNEESE